MISSLFKPVVTRVITPVATFALRIGATPNAVTWVGAIGVVASALYFYPRGDFFLGTMLICTFALSDLFDGTMARISKTGSSRWGSFLDSTIDRITDSAILIGLSLYLIKTSDPLTPVPASPLERIIAAPSLMRRSASPKLVAPQTNGTVNFHLSI